MKKIAVLVLALLMLVTVFAGCQNENNKTDDANTNEQAQTTEGAPKDEAPVDKDPIKIAIAAPQTGDFAEYGTGFKNAVQLKAEEINAAGGVLGREIEVVVFDDKNNGEEAATIAEKIAGDKDFVGVVGHFASGVCMAASPTYQEVGIVEISPSASHPDYTSEGDYIFRNNTVISVEAGEAIKIADEVLEADKIAILSVATDWGTSTAAIAEGIIGETEGLELTGSEEVMDGTVDFSPAITALEAGSPDVVLVAGMYNVLAPFATQYKAVNPDIKFVGFSNAYSQQLIELGGEFVEGIHLPAIFFSGSTDEDVASFVSTYSDKYGSDPSALTAQAYDSMGIIIAAIEAAGGTDRAAVRDQVASIDYPGVTGQTSFNEIGDADKTFNWLKVEDGKFVQVER